MILAKKWEKKHHRKRAWWMYICDRVGVRWHRLDSKTDAMLKNARTSVTRFFYTLQEQQLCKTAHFMLCNSS